ncbi:hypothetical protein BJ875DRAFT_476231 [Amylocarpus encephaloides]|uniref:Uncharacterized protein n=1 Tax=Amylocarpus encephaloides TaxID=45428 RepID=A0A9P7Y967_9HELO|nr:hypothetical protein BJ875DRAFT_476231 [Amylocarpus encephaloides]
MPSLTRPPSTASPVSAALESNDFEHTQSVALLAAPVKEREICDIDHETADDGESDDSNDGDYGGMNDAAASEMRHPSHSRKRFKQVKETEHDNVETLSTHSLDVPDQATIATSSSSVQESEEIPIHGCLILKTVGSKVVYCLTFSQALLPEPGKTSQRQAIPGSVFSSSDMGRLNGQSRNHRLHSSAQAGVVL